MKKNAKKIILSILIILTAFIIIRQFSILYLEFQNIKLPTKESRKIGDMSVHKWITVKKISLNYNISEEDIFKQLEIVPEDGDDNLCVEELGEKYKKTSKEMKDNLKKIIEGNKHE